MITEDAQALEIQAAIKTTDSKFCGPSRKLHVIFLLSLPKMLLDL